jgi:hypothetical protein
MGPALNLNLQGPAIAEQSQKWLTFDQIDYSPLDGTLKYVYQTQLEELHSILDASGDRTVEQFVAVEEMQALTRAFWLAVVRVKREQEEERKKAWAGSKSKVSEAAEK